MLLAEWKVRAVSGLCLTSSYVRCRYIGPVKLGDLDFAGYTVKNQAYRELTYLTTFSHV